MGGSTMLYEELPHIESTPLDGWGRWLAPALVVAVGATLAVVLLLFGQSLPAIIAMALGAVGAAIMARRRPNEALPLDPLVAGPDYSLVGAALGLVREPVTL